MIKKQFNDLYLRNVFSSPYYKRTDRLNRIYSRKYKKKRGKSRRFYAYLLSRFLRVPKVMKSSEAMHMLMTAEKKRKTTDIARNLVGKAMTMIIGSVIITTSYTNAVEARRAEENTDSPTAVSSEINQNTPDDKLSESSPVTEKPSEQQELYDYANIIWIWSEDGTRVTAQIPSIDFSVPPISITADVTSKTEKATCSTDGKIVKKATIHAPDGFTYSDTKETVIPATGHSFKEISSDANHIAYQCENCGAEITVDFTVEEE
ncbi:MAG: hypothetical protein V3G42_11460 [Oscillospiraceae bacterium]